MIQEKNLNYTPRKILFRLIENYLLIHKSRLLLSLFLMAVIASSNAAQLWLIKPVLDEIFLKKNHQLLLVIPLALVIIGSVRAVASYYQNFQIKFVGQSVVNKIQIELYEHLVKSDISYLMTFSSGKLISRFSNDINSLRTSVANMFTNVTRETLTIIFLLGLMFYNEPVLSLYALFVFPLAIVPILKLGKRMRKIAGQTQESIGQYVSSLDGIFRNIRVVKSFNKEDFEIASTKNFLDNLFKLYHKAIRVDSLVSPIVEMLGAFGIAFIIYYGGKQVILGNTTTGSFMTFIGALISAYKPLKGLADLNLNIQISIATAERIFTILDHQSIIESSFTDEKFKIKKGEIEFLDVSFKHSLDQNFGIKNINLKIKPNKMVAFVGHSGSGKSTMMDLILRFFEPSSGKIMIDGQDINRCSPSSVREAIALVGQDSRLFDASVLQNILYGNIEAKAKEVNHASVISGAIDFIKDLPMGADTQIGQDGNLLSGGQKQKLSIARALIKKAKIIIFDEATSALDQVSEQRIKESIEILKNNHTILIVAHRLSTIINADMICVMKQGEIVEQGTHHELLAKKGEYYNLYNRQTN